MINCSLSDFMNPKDARRYDLYISVSVAAAKMAVEHSGLVIDDGNRDRIGVSELAVELSLRVAQRFLFI